MKTGMNYNRFLDRVVSDGIQAARHDYEDGGDKLNGSIAGFEACRGESPIGLAALLDAASTATRDARGREAADYWWFRCYELEVEWVCNCVSAMLHNEGLPTIVNPTYRGAMKAAEVLGGGEGWRTP